MKFSIKDFFSKCDQVRSLLRIWSHLLKKSLIENFIVCASWILLICLAMSQVRGKKIHKGCLLICLEEGGVLEVSLLGRGQIAYLGKEVFVWETGVRRKLYRLTIKWTLSKTVFKDFSNTLRVPSTSLLHHTKNAYFWICLQNFFWRPSFFKMQGNLWKIIATSNVSKNAAHPQVFFGHILRIVTNRFSILFRILPLYFSKLLCTIQFHACFYTPNERCKFLSQWLVVMLLIPPVVVKWWATPMQKII